MKMSDIMTPSVVTVTPETTLRDAAEIFAADHISGAPVIDGRKIVGLISADDVISFAASMPGLPDEPAEAADCLLDRHIVNEVMTRKPIALSPNDLVSTAAELMYHLSIRRVVIVDDSGVVGMVSALDVAQVVAEGQVVS